MYQLQLKYTGLSALGQISTYIWMYQLQLKYTGRSVLGQISTYIWMYQLQLKYTGLSALGQISMYIWTYRLQLKYTKPKINYEKQKQNVMFLFADALMRYRQILNWDN